MRSFLSVVSVLALLSQSAIAHPMEEWNALQALARRAVSPDMTCGGVNGYTCPTASSKCCSQHGWCGDTAAYCGTGCQQAFGSCTGVTTTSRTTTTTTTTSPPPTTPTTTTRTTTTTPSTPTTSTTPPQQVDDYECGPAKGGKRCSGTQCCSQYGWCGTSSAYCGTGCLVGFGTCSGSGTTTTTRTTTTTAPGTTAPGTTTTTTRTTTTTAPPTSTNISTNGRCGPQGQNKICPNSQCCSFEGYCGTDQYDCQAPDCQRGFGRCDADLTPPGASTYSGGTRARLGNVPYGVDIWECTQPNTLALTYDDGPWDYTPALLTYLKQQNAKATFFVTGVNLGKGRIDDPARPWAAMINQMITDGHQIASHSWSHADLSTLSDADRETEMIKNEMALRNIMGMYPTYMRPPYSSCNSACVATMNKLGYHITYFDFDTEDYLHTTPATAHLTENVIDTQLSRPQTRWLSILHDIHEQTVSTFTPYFITKARAKGFNFVTVGECLGDPKANWYRT